jgi:hypothetical protein
MIKTLKSVIAVYLFLIFGLISNVKAESLPVHFGSWIIDVGESESFIYAATFNDSGNFFGQYCYLGAGSCMWFLGMTTACKEGAQYPVLANSDVGAIQLQLLCTGELGKGYYRYAFTDFDAIDNIVKKGLRVGFAYPLQSDLFSVTRFNLNGSNSAVSVMRKTASNIAPSNVPPANEVKDTRDVVM